MRPDGCRFILYTQVECNIAGLFLMSLRFTIVHVFSWCSLSSSACSARRKAEECWPVRASFEVGESLLKEMGDGLACILVRLVSG